MQQSAAMVHAIKRLRKNYLKLFLIVVLQLHCLLDLTNTQIPYSTTVGMHIQTAAHAHPQVISSVPFILEVNLTSAILCNEKVR